MELDLSCKLPPDIVEGVDGASSPDISTEIVLLTLVCAPSEGFRSSTMVSTYAGYALVAHMAGICMSCMSPMKTWDEKCSCSFPFLDRDFSVDNSRHFGTGIIV